MKGAVGVGGGERLKAVLCYVAPPASPHVKEVKETSPPHVKEVRHQPSKMLISLFSNHQRFKRGSLVPVWR